MGSSPLLVTVSVKGELANPTCVAGKLRPVGLTEKVGGRRPVPLMGTVSAFTPTVEEEIVSVAAAPPDDDGVKTTCTVQLAPPSRLVPQVVAPVEKLPAAGPVIWNPTFARPAPPLLVTVRVDGVLAMPTSCGAKLRLV